MTDSLPTVALFGTLTFILIWLICAVILIFNNLYTLTFKSKQLDNFKCHSIIFKSAFTISVILSFIGACIILFLEYSKNF